MEGGQNVNGTTGRRVVVAGGGIAGLGMVRALRQAGMEAVALEARKELPDAGFAVNLPGNAITALDRLGLGAGLAGLGSPVRRREYRSERGRLLFSVDETEFWGASAQPRCLRRSDLTALLARGLPEGSLQLGRRVTSVTQPASGPVEVSLADGSAERCALVVGADGVHSVVRDAVSGGDAAPRPALLSNASWRFMVPDPGVGCWTLWSGRNGALFLLIPVDRGEAYGWVSAPGRTAGELPAVFASFPGIVRETLDAALAGPVPPYHSPLVEVRPPNWTRGRAVLIGDAAHAMTPAWAQGAALALEDALVLAEALSAHSDWDRAGLDYERRRRPRVDKVAAATDRMSRLALLPARLRDLVSPFAGPRGYRAAYGPLRAGY